MSHGGILARFDNLESGFVVLKEQQNHWTVEHSLEQLLRCTTERSADDGACVVQTFGEAGVQYGPLH